MDIVTFIFALLPILILFLIMGIFKISGDKSAVITLLSTIIIAICFFNYPLKDIGLVAVYGSLKAIFPILFIIVMAIFSYNILVFTNSIEIIKTQFIAISSEKHIQVLLLTWGFGGFLESMAGFGTAVAIPAAILISLGFKPIFSAVASLVANSVATAFGSVGVPVKVLAEQAGIEDIYLLSSQVVFQLSPLVFIVPLMLMFMTTPNIKLLPRYIFLSIIVGGSFTTVQFLSSIYLGPETPSILGSLSSIIVIVIYAKYRGSTSKDEQHLSKFSDMKSIKAWSIYGIVLFLIFATGPLFPLRDILNSCSISSFNFNILDMSSGVSVARSIDVRWLTDAGSLLFISSIVGGLIQGAKLSELLKLLVRVLLMQRKTMLTVCSLIVLSSVMDFSGMISQIGLGIVYFTGSLYPLFAPAIGCLGTFLTGSDTSSNILFGKLQVSVAESIGEDPSWLAAANTAGATGGKIVSPQSIAIATSSCNLQGREGEIMKKAIPYAIVYIVIVGIVVYFGSKCFV